LAALPYLAPALIAGAVVVFFLYDRKSVAVTPPLDERNPLRLWSALQMAAGFQIAMSAVALLGDRLGELGIFGAAVALGLTDMDALTASMSSRSTPVIAGVAGRARAVGMLSNTVFKLAASLVLGSPAFRRRAAGGLATLAALIVAALTFL
jgi:uncharacterized membrane protein (DUF4010 family)